jgi:hypothetical protein
MITRFECFGMWFSVEFFDDCGTFDTTKVWARSGGWEVEVSWNFIDALRDRKYNPLTECKEYVGSPRHAFDTAMGDAMQIEADRYGRDDE